MEGVGSRVFRSSDGTGGNKDGGRKGEESVRLANTKICQGYIKILEIGKLLLLIY